MADGEIVERLPEINYVLSPEIDGIGCLINDSPLPEYVTDPYVDTVQSFSYLNNEYKNENGKDIFYPRHEFLCWNTKADGTGDNYYPGDRITIPLSNPVVYLYTTWREVDAISNYENDLDFVTQSEYDEMDLVYNNYDKDLVLNGGLSLSADRFKVIKITKGIAYTKGSTTMSGTITDSNWTQAINSGYEPIGVLGFLTSLSTVSCYHAEVNQTSGVTMEFKRLGGDSFGSSGTASTSVFVLFTDINSEET